MSNSTAGLLDASGAPIRGPARPGAQLLDSAGRTVQASAGPADLAGEIAEAVRQRPIAAVLVGIGFGLLLGRLTA